jgi:hypothetical protein
LGFSPFILFFFFVCFYPGVVDFSLNGVDVRRVDKPELNRDQESNALVVLNRYMVVVIVEREIKNENKGKGSSRN